MAEVLSVTMIPKTLGTTRAAWLGSGHQVSLLEALALGCDGRVGLGGDAQVELRHFKADLILSPPELGQGLPFQASGIPPVNAGIFISSSRET